MKTLDLTDIQGNLIRGYRLPYARYSFFRFGDPGRTKSWLLGQLDKVTSAERWEKDENNRTIKPETTLNIGFTFSGLVALHLPWRSLYQFPLEFQQGMRRRAQILGDVGPNAPDHWDEVWQEEPVHVWVSINAQTRDALAQAHADLLASADAAGMTTAYVQDAAALKIGGHFTPKEHFGYTDGIGQPQFEVPGEPLVPGRGKLTEDGGWAPLAAGEFLLGHPNEAEEIPPAPWPHMLARNGTFMVYRKLHQNVSAFRNFVEEKAKTFPGGDKELLMAKFVGRWRDGTPLELSPDKPDPALAGDVYRNNSFRYLDPAHDDGDGHRCPMGAHIRRTNTRDSLGFMGGLANRRRLIRRGLPYGDYVPEDQRADDTDERGVIFMVLNADFATQFEFVQQQWINYGNDFKQGSDRDPIVGNHALDEGRGKMVIPSDAAADRPAYICANLPNFIETRGGDYFFLPSITALRLIGEGTIDPR